MSESQNKPKNKHISIILRVIVALFACVLIARDKDLDFKKIAAIFSDISLLWVLAVVAGVFVFSQVILAVRWWLFMRAWNIHLGCWSAIKLTFLGLYFNNFLPGSVGGDLVRAWYVAQHTHRRTASVISVFVDRVLALFGTILMALTALVLAGQKGIFTGREKSGISRVFCENRLVIFTMSAVVLFVVILIIAVPSGRNFLKTLFKKLSYFGRGAAEQAVEAGLMLIRKPYLLPESLSLTFILQGMVVTSLWFLGRRMGIPTELKAYFVFFPVMWVVGSIPVSIAGIGIVEGGLIMLFTQFGSAASPELKSAVAALALGQRLVWIIASLPGLFVHLSGRHLPDPLPQLRNFSVDKGDG